MLKLLTKMINEIYTKSYCKDDISLIENYDKAIADTTRVWDCHHRRETVLSRKDLIEIGEYYNRPACELIFLTHSEHISLHMKGKPLTEDQKKKLSEAHKGKSFSVETRKKLSELKIGKPKSAETRKKISESKKGSYFFNNGVKSIRAKTCPEGFVPGRLKRLD